MIHRKISILATVVISTLFAVSICADEIRISEDGWYSWEVPAGHNGRKSCCYNWKHGSVERKGCRLGNGMTHFTVSEPCESYSETMNVFVEIKGGKVRDIWPISSDCPVKADSDIRRIENVTEADSIAWLEHQAQNNRKIADEAIMTVSFHTKEVALESLFGLLENRNQHQKNREQALFWLVQSDYDEAFAYLDRLLD